MTKCSSQMMRAGERSQRPSLLLRTRDTIEEMKPAVSNWLQLAAEDYDDSLYLFQGARYPNAIYLICQAIEKLLKATRIEILNQMAHHSHNLESLAKKSGLPFSDDQYSQLAELFKHYKRVRYRDIAQAYYNTKAKVGPIMDQAKEIYLWTLNNLENQSTSS